MKKTTITSSSSFLQWVTNLNFKCYLTFACLIVVLAVVLRFYKLADVPHGMTWDEAAIGYNGFAILHTRRDEWMVKLPVSFKSFGDYKSPFAIYVNGVFTFIFGMNLWAVRFPFALAGVCTVIGAFLLGYLLAKKSLPEKEAKAFSLGLGFLMAVSPWAVHFSRIGFESGMALSLVVWGVVGTLVFFDLPRAITLRNKVFKLGCLLVGLLSFVASFYTYHSSKIVTPLLLLTIAVLYWPLIKKNSKTLFGGIILGALLLFPLMKDTFLANGGERFSQASVFGQHLSLPVLLQTLGAHVVIHFSPAYLIFGQTVTLRHGDGHWGVLFVTELVLVITGIIFLFAKLKGSNSVKSKREMWLALIWILVGTLPAVIGTDVPHSNRALLALPGFLILALFGFVYLLKWLAKTRLDLTLSGSKGESHLLVKTVAGLFILFHLLLLSVYLHDYYTTYARLSANDFQDGFLEAFQFAVKNEATSDQILVSDKYGQAYIFALFVRKTNPIWYQGGIMVKYLYVPKLSVSDLNRKNTVLIATPDQIPPEEGDQLVYGADGQVKFVLVKTK